MGEEADIRNGIQEEELTYEGSDERRINDYSVLLVTEVLESFIFMREKIYTPKSHNRLAGKHSNR